jgi:hypothetical protein
MTKQDVEKEIRKLKKEVEDTLKNIKVKAPKGLLKKVVGIVVLVLVAREALKRFKAKKVVEEKMKKGKKPKMRSYRVEDSSWDARR